MSNKALKFVDHISAFKDKVFPIFKIDVLQTYDNRFTIIKFQNLAVV